MRITLIFSGSAGSANPMHRNYMDPWLYSLKRKKTHKDFSISTFLMSTESQPSLKHTKNALLPRDALNARTMVILHTVAKHNPRYVVTVLFKDIPTNPAPALTSDAHLVEDHIVQMILDVQNIRKR